MTTTDDNSGAQTSQHATNSLAFTHLSQTRSGLKYEVRMPCTESVDIDDINNLTVITATNVYKRRHLFDYLTRNTLAEFVGEGLSPHAFKDLYYAKPISHDLSSVPRSFDLPNLRELTLAISLDTIRCSSNDERLAVIREISDDSLNQLLARAPAINKLDISFNMPGGFDFEYAAPCSGMLSNFKPQSLESISLEGFTDTDNFLSSVMRQHCRTLTEVGLGNISVGNQPLTTIFEAIEEAIVKKVTLSGTLKGSNGREVLKLNDVGKDAEDLQKALERGQRAIWISLLNQYIEII